MSSGPSALIAAGDYRYRATANQPSHLRQHLTKALGSEVFHGQLHVSARTTMHSDRCQVADNEGTSALTGEQVVCARLHTQDGIKLAQ